VYHDDGDYEQRQRTRHQRRIDTHAVDTREAVVEGLKKSLRNLDLENGRIERSLAYKEPGKEHDEVRAKI